VLAGECSLNGRCQVRTHTRLDDVRGPAGVHGRIQEVGILVDGKKNNSSGASRVDESSCYVDAAELPHRDVEDNDIGPEAEIFAQNSVSVADGTDHIVLLVSPEQLTDMIHDNRVIIRKKYGCNHECTFASPRAAESPASSGNSAMTLTESSPARNRP